MLVQMIYISTPVGAEVSTDFIKAAQHRNRQAGISGIIITSPKFYIQLLEGDRHSVNQLYSKIMRNECHRDLILLRYTEIKKREFSDWSMVHISEEDLIENFVMVSRISSHVMPSDVTGVEALALMRRIAAVFRVKNLGGDSPKWIVDLADELPKA